MEILGYILAILIGLSTGMIGAGGSILAIPILVYCFGTEAAVTAPAYSLFIVGASSLVGVWVKARKKEVNFKSALFFGIPTIIAIFITRKLIVPAIPESILTIGHFELTNRILIMSVFAITMITASISMIRGRRELEIENLNKKNHVINFIGGLGVGSLSGFVGAGGGFIIIPALIRLGNHSMKEAIGTSLAIISLNSLFGFVGSVSSTPIDWQLLLVFTLLAIAGIFVGNYFSDKVNGAQLKKAFGWFVLLMGSYILIKELILTV
ncbi:MAG: sulfite exporter TauE/SafE family protein [Flavobacteriales bacterium]|nr:sulfite exporter TauE/SafE family protein [Flavobacteriales bacterium]